MYSSPATPTGAARRARPDVHPRVRHRPADAGARRARRRHTGAEVESMVASVGPYRLTTCARARRVRLLHQRRRKRLAAAEERPAGERRVRRARAEHGLQKRSGRTGRWSTPPSATARAMASGVLHRGGRKQQHPRAGGQRRPELPHGDVEGDRTCAAAPVARTDAERLGLPRGVADQAPVLHHHALGAPRGARGVDDVRQVLRA